MVICPSYEKYLIGANPGGSEDKFKTKLYGRTYFSLLLFLAITLSNIHRSECGLASEVVSIFCFPDPSSFQPVLDAEMKIFSCGHDSQRQYN